jgi:hypothetical protein
MTAISPEIIQTKTRFDITLSEKIHGVVITGMPKLSAKLQGIVAWIVAEVNTSWPACSHQHVLKSLVFADDEYSSATCGMCWPMTGSAIISLRRIVNLIFTKYSTEQFHLSLGAMYMTEVIRAMSHEIGHINHWHSIGPEAYNALAEERREEMADDFAMQMLEALALKLDLEPEALVHEPYLGTRAQEWFIKNPANAGVRKVQEMIAGGLQYWDNGADIKRGSLKGYLRDRFDQMHADERWEQPVYPVELVFEGQRGEEIVITPEVPVIVAPAPVVSAPAMSVITGAEGEVIKIEEGDAVAMFDDDPEADTIDMVEAREAIVMSAAGAPPAPPAEVGATGTSFSTDVAQLPAGVVANMEAMAANAAPRVYEKPKPKMYPRHNHTPENIKAFLKEVWMRLYSHIFNKCGWTGEVGTGNFHFTAAGNITEHVNISDLIHKYNMPDVVMEYNTHDANGKKMFGDRAEKCNGTIRGEIFTKAQLPGYTVYLNFWGRGVKRVLAPQNLLKTSRTAMAARNGAAIAWIMNGDYEDDRESWVKGGCKGESPKNFIVEINNNNYIVK